MAKYWGLCKSWSILSSWDTSSPDIWFCSAFRRKGPLVRFSWRSSGAMYHALSHHELHRLAKTGFYYFIGIVVFLFAAQKKI